MTKVLVISDSHIEMHGDSRTRFIKSLAPADILIMAGDVCPIVKDYFEEVIYYACSKYPYVLHSLGNHEFYSSSPTEVTKKLGKLQAKYSNYYVLEKDIITIDNITFAGATTWFPDTPDSRLLQMYINDFKYIKDFVPWVYEQNKEAMEFWETVEADVWISHYPGSQQSTHPKFRGDKLNCYFIEPTLGNLISYREPKYHISGHTHYSSQYYINKTLCISNPYGYESSSNSSLNPEFKADLIIEL